MEVGKLGRVALSLSINKNALDLESCARPRSVSVPLLEGTTTYHVPMRCACVLPVLLGPCNERLKHVSSAESMLDEPEVIEKRLVVK
jgi:hypothetical protein